MLGTVGVDAIGLNFYEQSKRFVDPHTAAVLAKTLPSDVKRVGVFVNASSAAIREIVRQVSLDYVQLHGDEPPEFLSELDGLQIIRAYRCPTAADIAALTPADALAPAAALAPLRDYLSACVVKPVAVLVDAYDPSAFGGTGKTLHWPDLADRAAFVGDLPLILAGGLTAENVPTAIRQAKPNGVDTASGVESNQPGRKDADLSRAFVAQSRTAFSLNS